MLFNVKGIRIKSKEGCDIRLILRLEVSFPNPNEKKEVSVYMCVLLAIGRIHLIGNRQEHKKRQRRKGKMVWKAVEK